MAGQYHILVAEDEECWREDMFRDALEDEGYQVVTSSSYNEAIIALKRQIFNLVVIDVNLTGIPGNRDGLRVLEQMAALGHNSPYVIISGAEGAHEYSMKKFEPTAFIDKATFEVTEFADIVRSALLP